MVRKATYLPLTLILPRSERSTSVQTECTSAAQRSLCASLVSAARPEFVQRALDSGLRPGEGQSLLPLHVAERPEQGDYLVVNLLGHHSQLVQLLVLYLRAGEHLHDLFPLLAELQQRLEEESLKLQLACHYI